MSVLYKIPAVIGPPLYALVCSPWFFSLRFRDFSYRLFLLSDHSIIFFGSGLGCSGPRAWWAAGYCWCARVPDGGEYERLWWCFGFAVGWKLDGPVGLDWRVYFD